MELPSLALTRRTPEAWLDVLNDLARHNCSWSDIAPATLSFETTIDDWCEAMEWDGVGNAIFGLSSLLNQQVIAEDWLNELRPTSRRTLADLCRKLAREAVCPAIAPLSVLGRRCVSAGAFVTVRNLVHDAGWSVETLRPSSPIEPYIRRDGNLFARISMLAPGTIPTPRFDQRFDQRMAFELGISCMAVLAYSCAKDHIGVIHSICLACFIVIAWLAVARLWPAPLDFGELVTFKDLCRRLAGDPDTGQDPSTAAS